MAPKLLTLVQGSLQRLGCWEGLWEVLGIQKVWQVWGWKALGRGRFGKGRLWVWSRVRFSWMGASRIGAGWEKRGVVVVVVNIEKNQKI